MQNNNLQFAFFGTPDVALHTLEFLFAHGFTPKVIVTSPDRPSGRGMHMTETPIALFAKEHNILCLKPEKITQEFIDTFATYSVELSIVVAYGKILPEKLITIPKYGTINIHYSLLPHYRGASPVEHALLDGLDETGISIQQMAYKLDSGPILSETKVPIKITTTKDELRNQLINVGAENLVALLPKIISGDLTPKEQNEKDATFCSKIHKEDGQLDLSQDGWSNYNKYRAYSGWPGTFFFATRGDKKIRIKITDAHYENNLFIIKKVIPEGKKEIAYEDFVRNFS